jgi:SAM-dependent methyltransferase
MDTKPYAQEEAQLYTATRSTWPEVIAFFLKYIHSANFLDAGCGTGNDLKLIYDKTGFLGHGCDGSADMIAETKKKLPQADVRLANFDQDFPFDQSFETIYMHDVIHHLKHPEVFFKNVYNHLLPGGTFCLGSEFAEGLKEKFTSLYFPNAREKDMGRYPAYEHVHALLHDVGFVDIEVAHIDD